VRVCACKLQNRAKKVPLKRQQEAKKKTTKKENTTGTQHTNANFKRTASCAYPSGPVQTLMWAKTNEKTTF